MYLWNSKIFEIGRSQRVLFCETIIDKKYFSKISKLLDRYSSHTKRFTKNGLSTILRANRLRFDDEAMSKKQL